MPEPQRQPIVAMPVTSTTSKQEWTYSVLRGRIVNGTYPAGHRLVIDAIARELEVSPMPVREAIRRLEAEGWVHYRRNHGATVKPLEDEAWAQGMAAVAVLDGYAAGLAAEHLRPEDFERLRERNEAIRAALHAVDVLAVSEHNLAFHRAIQDRCPNEHIRGELISTQERLNILRSRIFMFIPGRGHESADEHDRLIEMLERRRPAAEIEAFAREHTLRTVAVFLERQA
jgi:DNA-binding GntR family transcriptional regulator